MIDRDTYLGNEGSTGQVTGKHLHLEIYVGSIDRGSGGDPGSTVDPRKFIREHLVSSPSKPNNNPNTASAENEDEMLWIANISGAWFLVVPTGAGKPNATALPGDSGMAGGGAAKAGIPVIKLKDMAALRRVANA